MAGDVTRDPSPVRSAFLHSGASLLTFGLVFALGSGAVALFGDEAAAGPSVRVALFSPDQASDPRLNPRLRTDDRVLARAPERRQLADVSSLQDEPSLGLDYREGASVRVSAAATDEPISLQTVRINGRDVGPGQSLSEVRNEMGSTAGAEADAPAPAEARADAPMNKYALDFENPDGRPTVSVIVGGLGINTTRTLAAIEDLPAEVTLSFAPTTPNLSSWVRRARSAGHEVLIEVPMEPIEYGRIRPHPDVLRASASAETNRARLSRYLPRNSGYFGVINYQGEQFAASADAVSPVLDLLDDKGLAVFQDASIQDGVLDEQAIEAGLVFGSALTAIDARPEGDEIETELLRLEAAALENGASLGTAMPFPITIDLLSAWVDRLDSKGIVLAPASYYAKQSGTTGQVKVAGLDPQG